MKKIVLAVIGLSAMLMNMSCSKEIVTDGNEKGLVTVSIEAKEGTEPETKVSYDYDSASKYAFSWDDAENLKVFVGDADYTFTKGDGDRFSGDIAPFTDKNVTAVWPSSSISSVDADATTITVNVPTEANVGADDYTSSLLVARNADVPGAEFLTSLSFHQVMAIIKLQVLGVPSDESVTKVKIHSNTADAITKSALVELSTGVSSSTSTASDVEVSVNNAAAGCNTIVNLALLPTSTASAYTFTIYSGETELGSYTTNKTVTFTRNNIYSMNIDCLLRNSSLKSGLYADLAFAANKTIPNSTLSFYGSGTATSFVSDKLGYVESTSDLACYRESTGKTWQDLSNGFTIETYVCPTKYFYASNSHNEQKFIGGTQGSNACLLVKNGRYVFSLHGENSWIDCPGPELTGLTNKWSHLVAVWNQKKMTLYVNGTEYSDDYKAGYYYPDYSSAEKITDDITTMTTTSQNFSLFANTELEKMSTQVEYTVGNNHLIGYLGQTRVWSRALDEDEISSLNNNIPGGSSLCTETFSPLK